MFTRVIIYSYMVVLFSCCVSSQYRFGCEKDFCAKIAKCPQLNCRNGSRIIQDATACGCCPICVESLKLGDECKPEVFAAIPGQECGSGLICDKKEKKCVHAKTACIEDQRKYDAEFIEGEHPFAHARPDCDEFGYYKNVVCISDVLCYCVDKHGKRIFGTVLADKKSSTQCDCSRDFEEFPKSKTIDNFLRCLPNGNYDKLQCTEKWCYCMQDIGQGIGYVTKANTKIQNLQCYDENRHEEYDQQLRSKCLQERYRLQQEIKKHGDRTIIGLDLPDCDLDGSYAPVQCKKDRCYCVKKNGMIYEGFNVPRKEAKDMTCRCVREKEMVSEVRNKNKNMILFEQFKCLRNGNYKRTQCVESTSITVSDMGNQINIEDFVEDCE